MTQLNCKVIFCSCYCKSYLMFSLNSPIITESSPNHLKLTLTSNRIYKATFKVPHPSWPDVRFYIHRGAQFSVPGCHFDEGSSPQWLQVLLGKRGEKWLRFKQLGSFFSATSMVMFKKPHRNGTYYTSCRLQGAC